jgi:hypothetical protein
VTKEFLFHLCRLSNPLAAPLSTVHIHKNFPQARFAELLAVAPKQSIKLAGFIQAAQVIEAADGQIIDENLRHRPALRQAFHLGSFFRIVGHVNLFELHLLRAQ